MSGQGKESLQVVALHYDQEPETVPRLVASGRGELAEQILAAARKVGIDIVEDPDLMEVLGRLPVGAEIPPELFEVVAELLVFLYRLNGRYESEFDG